MNTNISLTNEQTIILRQGLEPEGVKVWYERCYAGPEQFGRVIGHATDKDLLLELGLLQSKDELITEFVTTKAGYEVLYPTPKWFGEEV